MLPCLTMCSVRGIAGGNRRDTHCNVRKAVLSVELSMIFDRLGSTSDSWWSRLDKLSQGLLLRRYFAAKREPCAKSRATCASITSQTWANPQRDKATPRFG